MKWLLFDCPNLCWAAWYTTGQLTSGVIYGFLRQMLTIQELYPSHRPVFTFDDDLLKRNLLFPGYKARRSREPEVSKQILTLKKELLPSIGYSNVLYQAGFEADDIIASTIQCLHMARQDEDEVVIVSRDHDMYQLLRPNVSIYHPVDKRVITIKDFQDLYGLDPVEWVNVKAIAGCNSDDVPGVVGVAEKTAIKYLLGKLNPGVIKDRIVAAQEQINFNYKLIRLPFPGCPSFNLKNDTISRTRWSTTMQRYRMTSLQTSFPRGVL